MTPKEFFAFAKKHGALMVDLKFTDLLGTWQHCSYPTATWDEGTFEDGVGFDGSSIRGWQAINVSDMLAVPDPSTALIDPFFAEPTVSVVANIVDPETREDYSRDPRHVARKATEYLKKTKIADTCYVGPEPEFFIFDQVRYEQNQYRAYHEIDSVEGAWNTARFEEPNLGYKPSYKGGYFPVSPTDTYHDLRGEMCYEMMKLGIVVEAHHHEVGTAGAGGDRHAVRAAALDGRSVHVVQVRRQERGEAARQDGDVHAQACLRGQRQRYAHAHVAVEGRQAGPSPARGTQD